MCAAFIRSVPILRAIGSPALRRSIQTTSIARSSHGYGSGPADKDSSVPPATKEFLDKHGSPEGKDIPSPDVEGKAPATSAGAESGGESAAGGSKGKDLPKPNASSEDSAGDKSKPHYVCDPETKNGNDTPELVKPEDKK
ncbi:hypothetical protein [Phaffia rhodozyma]|uniref:Uncharacterized protein n=1 Tax=Phaffia rhodozyma TaxID=264483 RepID=A0A0F7SFN7_PHARH|nr:hypothetical protein [Phaffia rhodozyma]